MSEVVSADARETAGVDLVLPSGREMSVTASVVDGSLVFEGDIILIPRELESGDPWGPERGAAVSDPAKLWPEARIRYRIDPDLSAPERVHEAIAHWTEHTVLRFEEVDDDADGGWISFEDQGACFSAVGYTGSRQVVSIGSGCSSGNAIHEIGHAVGLWHEQSRTDRDTYVRILPQNIDEFQLHNFDSMVNEVTDVGEYDFGSIMHYGPKFFSTNGQPTIEPIEPLPPDVVIGQRVGLSPGDIATVAAVYAGLVP